MKQVLNLKTLLLGMAIGGVVLSAAIAQTNAGKPSTTTTDTLPKKKKQIRDLDEAMLELETGEEDLRKALKEIDLQKIEADVRTALKEVDLTKLKVDMKKALTEVDMQKIQVDVQKAMKEAQNELSKIDMKEMQLDVERSLSKVNLDKMKVDMEKMKAVDWDKMQKELDGIKPKLEKEMANMKIDLEKANEGIKKAKAEIASYQELVNALDADGLLEKEKDFKIAYKDGELTVNGKLLPADATRKYSKQLEGKKNFTMTKKEDGLNINNNNKE